MARSKLLFAIGLAWLIIAPPVSSSCMAFQSGSRSAAPVVGSGSRATLPSVGSPSFATPERSFAAPQSFGSSVSSQPVFQNFPDGSQAQPPIGSSTLQSNFPAFEFDTPTAQSTVSQPATAASQSSSIGIPASSLADPVFEISDPSSPYAVDHSAWNCLLVRYLTTDVQGLNRIRYRDVTLQDHNALKGYLEYLQSVDTRTLNRDSQLAFWFNLYNAKTVDIVLDNYPIRSIRQVKTKLTDFVGPFDDEAAVTVLGKPLSLNDIESGIVRPVWKDPRIHYALNCASFGCPNLATQAWTAENLDGRLHAAAYEYVNSGRAVSRGIRGVKVAKIFKWYNADFGGSDQAVLNHLLQYADQNTSRLLQGQSSIAGYFYDWSLNDARILRKRLFEPVLR